MNRNKPVLKIDWCSYKAAKYAVEHWHYSGCLPLFKRVCMGVWEDSMFIGCIVFSVGANRHIGSPYGLTNLEACELTRVALRDHYAPVTKMLSRGIGMLKKQSPKSRLIVSYADEEQGHIGKIYQAGNWIYVGEGKGRGPLEFKGRKIHQRTMDSSKYSTSSLAKLVQFDPSVHRVSAKSKHKYLYPLDKTMRKQILPLSQPYPKCATSIVNDVAGVQPEEGGEIPTVAFQDPA